MARDYQAWKSLFTVLAEPAARAPVQSLCPGVTLPDGSQKVAREFLEREDDARNNAEADRVMQTAIAALRAMVGDDRLEVLRALGELLDIDSDGENGERWAWLQVIRDWSQPDRAARPSLVPELRNVVAFAPDRPGIDQDPADWQLLIEEAQGKLLSARLARHLLSLSAADRARIVDDARATATSLGIPESLIRVPSAGVP